MNKTTSFNILHVCNYAAYYRGNFIDSLESLEKYQPNIKNFYLFPARAVNTAKTWITELNEKEEIAYYQKNSMLKNIILLHHIIRKHKINRIVVHFSDAKIDVVIKLLFSGKKVIRFFHCGCMPASSTAKQKLQAFLWKHNKLVGVSDAVTDEIRSVHPSFKIYSIPNAIHFERLNQIDPFHKEDRISLMVLGWDYKIKGIDLAIKAVDAVRKKYDVVLQIVGGKSESDVRNQVTKLLGQDVAWIRFLPTTNNIGTYYKHNNIFLSPSRQEAFGYANIEAVYCKNSIVLSKVGGQKDLKIEGAYWVEPDNIEDLKEKIETAILDLRNPEKFAQKERAKSYVEQFYSLEEWANKLANIL
ncbi:MAG: glycosyltransferase family 4 protein [Oscillospiraceae bacterium]|nr:glycosyltransferase family 4 protein [Oscillospiraceae bacterium]